MKKREREEGRLLLSLSPLCTISSFFLSFLFFSFVVVMYLKREREHEDARPTGKKETNRERKKERDEGWLEVEIERREGYNLDARVRPGIQTPPSLSRQKLSKIWWKQEEENQKASLCACREFLLSQRLFPSSTQGKKERNILYMHARSLSLLFLSQ